MFVEINGGIPGKNITEKLEEFPNERLEAPLNTLLKESKQNVWSSSVKFVEEGFVKFSNDMV